MPTLEGMFSALRTLASAGPGILFLIAFRSSLLEHRTDITDPNHRIQTIRPEHLYSYYDFIIIGGGSAGAALAARLSEIPEWRILLIEAGPDEPPIADIPQMFPLLQRGPFDWKFLTQKSNKYCLAMDHQRCVWPRGKVLGGSSVLNAMLYVRGNRHDYDLWAKYGNNGWNYDNVLYYFKKLEDMRDPNLINDYYHNTGGPITVEHFRYGSKMIKYFMDAVGEMGLINKRGDYNGAVQTGFARSHGTIRNGLRCSTAKGYLRQIWRRPNFHIMLHTFVHKINIDPYTKMAKSVIVETDNEVNEIYASKEIILSAGAIQTPQLLMLSGIGPGNHLKKHGIKVIKHSPGVGENLQDHVSAAGTQYIIQNPLKYNSSSLSYIIPDIFTEKNGREFIYHHRGPLYGLPACEVMGFINTKYQKKYKDWPDIQLFMGAYGYTADGGLIGKFGSGVSFDNYGEIFEPVIYKDMYMIVPLLMRPRSRGRILLKSSKSYEHPLIYANYFQDPYDLDVLVEGLKFVHKISYTKAMRYLNATINPYIRRNCPNTKFLSDEFWACHARHYSQTIYHPVGTAKMGPYNDKMAVVDPRLRVYGIKKLRVVDASIMPTIPSGNTNVPTIMIAEKAADMIKEEYRHYKN